MSSKGPGNDPKQDRADDLGAAQTHRDIKVRGEAAASGKIAGPAGTAEAMAILKVKWAAQEKEEELDKKYQGYIQEYRSVIKDEKDWKNATVKLLKKYIPAVSWFTSKTNGTVAEILLDNLISTKLDYNNPKTFLELISGPKLDKDKKAVPDSDPSPAVTEAVTKFPKGEFAACIAVMKEELSKYSKKLDADLQKDYKPPQAKG